jgi:hypothetical protein
MGYLQNTINLKGNFKIIKNVKFIQQNFNTNMLFIYAAIMLLFIYTVIFLCNFPANYFM